LQYVLLILVEFGRKIITYFNCYFSDQTQLDKTNMDKNMACYVSGTPEEGFVLVIQATDNNALNELTRQLHELRLLPPDFDAGKSYLRIPLAPSAEGIQCWQTARNEATHYHNQLEESGWR
jgi:hypothetical protein